MLGVGCQNFATHPLKNVCIPTKVGTSPPNFLAPLPKIFYYNPSKKNCHLIPFAQNFCHVPQIISATVVTSQTIFFTPHP